MDEQAPDPAGVIEDDWKPPTHTFSLYDAAVLSGRSEPCPFCEIGARRSPATILEEWADVMVIIPLNPVTPGHVLVIPKTHVPDFAANSLISARVMECAALYAVTWRVGDCNVITSRGEAATQTVRHLHLHVVPRRPGDGLALPWTGQAAPAAPPERTPRLRACVEAWPGAVTGGHDPRCCRYPKSCSATVYDPDRVRPEDLEATP